MKLAHSSPKVDISGRFGPMCIACGNTARFWVRTASTDRLVDLGELSNGHAEIVACGRCRSQRSVVISRVD